MKITKNCKIFAENRQKKFEKVGIDIMTVLEAAKTKYNFQVHYPSAGVGGPCLPVNSYQMINFAKNFTSKTFGLVENGRKINEKMPFHTVELLEDALNEINLSAITDGGLINSQSYSTEINYEWMDDAEFDILLKSYRDSQFRTQVSP